jgi:hypothetical protein
MMNADDGFEKPGQSLVFLFSFGIAESGGRGEDAKPEEKSGVLVAQGSFSKPSLGAPPQHVNRRPPERVCRPEGHAKSS